MQFFIYLSSWGKKNFFKTRLYRLIALLSYLGKMIEKVVTSWLIIFRFKTKLSSNLHFKTTLGRLVIYVISILSYDVEKAMEEKNIMSILTFDIKRKFCNVSKNRLIKQLLDQKISF